MGESFVRDRNRVSETEREKEIIWVENAAGWKRTLNVWAKEKERERERKCESKSVCGDRMGYMSYLGARDNSN